MGMKEGQLWLSAQGLAVRGCAAETSRIIAYHLPLMGRRGSQRHGSGRSLPEPTGTAITGSHGITASDARWPGQGGISGVVEDELPQSGVRGLLATGPHGQAGAPLHVVNHREVRGWRQRHGYMAWECLCLSDFHLGRSSTPSEVRGWRRRHGDMAWECLCLSDFHLGRFGAYHGRSCLPDQVRHETLPSI